MYAHSAVAPSKMIDIYSSSAMMKRANRRKSRRVAKVSLIVSAAVISAAALSFAGWWLLQSTKTAPKPGSDSVYPSDTIAAGIDISGKTYDEARALLSKHESGAVRPVTLTVQINGETETLTQDSFTYSFNTDEILADPSQKTRLTAKVTDSSVAKAADEIAEKYSFDPENAYVKAFHPFAEERFEYHESRDGLSVDAGDLKAEIKKALKNGSGNIVASAQNIPAEVTAEELKNSMVMLGSCETKTTTDTRDRINATHNMAVALEACNENNAILPGETWSFNACTGDSNLESNGYLPATVISNGQYTDGVGGGICQASSTIYDAALKANLEVVERTAHKWVSGYVPTGLDATIDYGNLDLKLRNNSENTVYLECRLVDNKLYAAFWGVKSSDYDEIVLRNQDGAEDDDGEGYTVTVWREYYLGGEKIGEEALPDSHYDIDGSHGHSFNAIDV